MKNKVTVSVAMATYNGEKYLKEQLDSILKNPVDEVIISDDGSTDKTCEIINDYKDKRIKLIAGPKQGVKQNFANAIKHTTGDIIFLSDQDDIWEDNKVEKVLDTFDKNPELVLVTHDAKILTMENNKIADESNMERLKARSGYYENILRNTYTGCCMAIKSDLKKYILPIPNNIEMHDQWIGVIACKYGKDVMIKSKLITYRRHASNVSALEHYPMSKMLKNRINLIKELNARARKIKRELK